MKNKKLALAELAKDCKLKHQYLNGDGETCAIGRLAQLSAVPDDTLRKAGGASIENISDPGIARAIADKFGLSMDEMRTIQRLNDDHSWHQELSTEERIAAVLKYVTSLPEEGGDN